MRPFSSVSLERQRLEGPRRLGLERLEVAALRVAQAALAPWARARRMAAAGGQVVGSGGSASRNFQ